ncbi:MAG TPA: hypothetical protein DDY32_00925 [Desulfobulbaceae bacterium]|nr:hypothetical protein [Desulfobulbaceae bacterium]
MKKIHVAAVSLMLLLSSVIFTGQSHSATDDDESITPSASPKKVDMRQMKTGNLPANLAGKRVITAEQLQNAGIVGKTGKNNQPVVIVTESQPGVKTGKFLQSNKNANNNTVQIPGVPGGVVIQEGSEKKNHKNINSRTDEILGGGDNF